MSPRAAVGAATGRALVLVPLAAAKAPTAVTGAATSVGATTAVVTGKVDPGGEATSWYVEYGPAARPRDEHGRLLRCTIVGTNLADRLVGTGRQDVICGLGGADVLVGRGGDDILAGGPGNDHLLPGPGRDRAFGQAGNDFVGARDGRADRVLGGPGADRARVDPRLDVTRSLRRVP